MLKAKELRQKYLDFFQTKRHTVISSASLIPEHDPTVLFTTAGMHPLTPYLIGEAHPAGRRLVNVQKCVRTGDIEEVGDHGHLTFFEMLGNWSLGDYFKGESINWAWEFVTAKNWLGIDPEKLAVTVFGGDSSYPDLKAVDQEAMDIWKKTGIREDRIAGIVGGVAERKDNWWGPAGQTGPCGPCTEIYHWLGHSQYPLANSNPATDPDNWLEIWNIVLMRYNKTINDKFEFLKQKNIDTGMGLERTLLVLNNLTDIYRIDTLWPLIQKIEEISGQEYIENMTVARAMRIICDHLRAATMIIADQRGIGPSNVDQGYIVRRLLRRAIRQGHALAIKENFCSNLAGKVIELFSDVYPEIAGKKDFVLTEIAKEESNFRNTLEKGLKRIKKMIDKQLKNATAVRVGPDFGARNADYINIISGKEIFNLYQSYGFPPEMSEEELANYGMIYNKEEFKKEFKQAMDTHQELSRQGAANKFKGGLADESEMSTKYHTATHLLQAALRQTLGPQVEQRGSNITAERLRFDFSYPEKLTVEQRQAVEDLVNEAIQKDYQVSCEEMTAAEAKAKAAVGLFADRYGARVKVYTIGDNNNQPFSREICGGPHVERAGQLGGKFKIIKEEASSAGVRRIKAILE